MRFFSFLIYFCCIPALCALSSCDDRDEPNNDEQTETTNIKIEVLSEPSGLNTPEPRMVVTVDDWYIIEYSSKGMDEEDMITMHFMNEKKNISMVVSGHRNSLMCFELNPFTGVRSDTVIIASEKQNKLCMAFCKMNWSNMSYSVLSENVFGEESAQKPNSSFVQKYRDENDDIRAIFAKFLNNLSGKISNYAKPFGKFSKSAGDVADIWTKVVIPYAKFQLYADNPQVQEEIQDRYAVDRFKEYVYTIIPVVKNGDYLIKKVKYIYETVKSMFDNLPSTSLTNDDVIDLSLRISSLSNSTYKAQKKYSQEPTKYMITARIRNINANSVTLFAYYDCLDGQPSYISEYGVEMFGDDGKHEIKKLPNLDSEIEITGLTTGTSYIAYVYIISFGRKYETVVNFTTEFKFGLYPESIFFDKKGGSKAVALTAPKELLKSWDIKSNPDWCKIEKSATSFFVEVSETNESRNGEIVVVANLNDGQKTEATLKVEQLSEEDNYRIAFYMQTKGEWHEHIPPSGWSGYDRNITWDYGHDWLDNEELEYVSHSITLFKNDGKYYISTYLPGNTRDYYNYNLNQLEIGQQKAPRNNWNSQITYSNTDDNIEINIIELYEKYDDAYEGLRPYTKEQCSFKIIIKDLSKEPTASCSLDYSYLYKQIYRGDDNRMHYKDYTYSIKFDGFSNSYSKF